MKIFRILPIAAIACLAVSCQSGSGSGLSENSTPADSLMYYLGQMNGSDYLRESNRDTTMKEASQKQAYLSGVRAGLSALKEGDELYNKGVMLGIQMASQIMNFAEQMGVEVNKSTYEKSLANVLMSDSIYNSMTVQGEFRRVLGNIEAAKDARDKAASQETLKQVAEKDGYPKISDDLYGKVSVTTDGAAFAENEEVNVQAVITKENGEEVNMPLPAKGKVGNRRNFPEVVSSAILSLKSGETGEFLTSAHALAGMRAQQLGLTPSDVLKVKLTVSAVEPEENKEAK